MWLGINTPEVTQFSRPCERHKGTESRIWPKRLQISLVKNSDVIHTHPYRKCSKWVKFWCEFRKWFWYLLWLINLIDNTKHQRNPKDISQSSMWQLFGMRNPHGADKHTKKSVSITISTCDWEWKRRKWHNSTNSRGALVCLHFGSICLTLSTYSIVLFCFFCFF